MDTTLKYMEQTESMVSLPIQLTFISTNDTLTQKPVLILHREKKMA